VGYCGFHPVLHRVARRGEPFALRHPGGRVGDHRREPDRILRVRIRSILHGGIPRHVRDGRAGNLAVPGWLPRAVRVSGRLAAGRVLVRVETTTRADRAVHLGAGIDELRLEIHAANVIVLIAAGLYVAVHRRRLGGLARLRRPDPPAVPRPIGTSQFTIYADHDSTCLGQT
jgi:hypothetical protein